MVLTRWVVWIEKGQLFIAYYYDLMHPMILFLNDSSSIPKHISPHIYCHLIEYRIMYNHFMCFLLVLYKDDLKFFVNLGMICHLLRVNMEREIHMRALFYRGIFARALKKVTSSSCLLLMLQMSEKYSLIDLDVII